ncbi:MAG TPA: benzylsuccinate synthase subunit delta, partial [Desulfotomaculum sp.]|nr:benzylsuccinate synthase subunit delta [Desulfotomaculum sp.]
LRAGAKVRIRLAIIPDFNNSKEDFEAYAGYIDTLPGKIVAVDILPFHSYAENKYALLGRLSNYKYRDFKSLFGEDVVDLLKAIAPVARANKFECTIGGLSGVTAQSLS